MKKPESKKTFIPQDIKKACESYINFLSSDRYHEDRISDYENEIFEKAMEAVFGADVWDYVNSKIV